MTGLAECGLYPANSRSDRLKGFGIKLGYDIVTGDLNAESARSCRATLTYHTRF
jgi:hypothetical protein